jgi:hypothetical protein
MSLLGRSTRAAHALALLASMVVLCAGSAEPLDSHRELLAIFEMDDAFFAGFADDRPLDEAERAKALKVLHRLRKADPGEIDRWSQNGPAWKDLAERPERHHGAMTRLDGYVTRIEPAPLTDRQARQFELVAWHRCELEVEGGGRAVVFVEAAPVAWKRARPIRERAQVRGLFLKRLPAADRDGANRTGLPLLVAPRVAWFPDTLLGKSGMDVGLLDDVVDRERLRPEETEAFYQLLAAAGRAEPGELERHAARRLAAQARELERSEAAADPARKARLRHTRVLAQRGRSDVEPLFNRPHEARGELVLLEGTVLRAVEIRIEPPEMAARVGRSRYFEVDLVTEDSHANPLCVCLADLPEGLSLGEQLNEQVRVAGFFFKQWKYPRGGRKRPEAAAQFQLAPLLVGRQGEWLKGPDTSGGMALTALVVGLPLLLVVALVGWRWLADSRLRARATRFELPERVSLEGLVQRTPDEGPRPDQSAAGR